VLRVYTLLQSLALAVLLTWPVSAHLSASALGSPDGDGLKHVWNLWWMRQEFWDGTWGLATTWVGFPAGMQLYPIEPFNGIFAALAPIDPVTLSNLLALLHLTLLGWCMCWLGWLQSGRWSGALAAGALAQCSAFAAFTLHVGVGEMRELWWLPLGFCCLLRAQEEGQRRWFFALGATLALAMLSCFYIGFFLALGVLTHALLTLRGKLSLLPRYAATAVAAAVLTLVPFRFFAATYDPLDDRSVITFSEWVQSRPRATYETAAVEPSQLLSWRNDDRATASRQIMAYTGGRYLGLLTLVLAGLGVAAAPRRSAPWLGVAAVAVVFSLGTVLLEGGEVVVFRGARLVLPLAPVNQVLGFYAESINFPARFLALTAVALPAAAAAASRWRWTLVLVPLACLDMVQHDLVPWPRATFTLPDARALQRDHSRKGVLNITPFTYLKTPDAAQLLAYKNPEGRAAAIAAQIAMQRRFDIVPIERMDIWASAGLLWALPLPMLESLATASPSNAAAHRADLWLLRDRGFDTLLLTFVVINSEVQRVEAFMTSLCGEPEKTPIARVWTIPTVEATEQEYAGWRAAHEAKVKLIKPPKMGVQFPKSPKPATLDPKVPK
jgi:hypothetical protein